MKLNDLFGSTNSAYMQQALQEAAEKFQAHPSSASLTWANARYQRLLRENNQAFKKKFK